MLTRRFACGIVAVCTSFASSQWTNDPAVNTPTVVAPSDQDVFKLAVAPDGSSWIGWYDFQPGGIQVRVQRLDADGNQTFDSAGLIVSTNPQNTSVTDWDLRADSNGNCMLAFNDIRSGGDLDIYAYLISPSGTQLWGPNGVTISDNTDFEADPRIVELGNGEYVVTWPRFGTGRGLYMQRLSASGAIQLAPGGVKIAGVGNESPAFHEVIAVSASDVIISWVRDTTSFSSPRHVFVQRFDLNGAGQWGGGNPVVVMNTTVVPIAHRPRLISDDQGGAVIAWHDTRTGVFNCWAQRLDANGSPMFAAQGAFASGEPARQQLDPAIAMLSTGDVMMYFRNLDGSQNQQSLNVQRFDATGARMLTDNGIALLPFDGQFKSPPRAARVNGGVAGIVDRQPVLGNLNGILELLRVDAAGAFLDGGPVSVSTATSSKGRLALAEAGSGALIAAWGDDRNGNDDGFAQRINADGSLGGGTTPCPGDFNGDTNLDFFDVLAFLTAFANQDPAADLNNDTNFDFFDVLEFLNAFANGCP